MSKTASIVYKCRMCGEKFDGWTTFSPKIINVVMDLTILGEKPPDTPVNMHIIHHCGNNRKGVADLIGIEGDF